MSVLTLLVTICMGFLLLLSLYSWSVIFALMLDIRGYRRSLSCDENLVKTMTKGSWQTLDEYCRTQRIHVHTRRLYRDFLSFLKHKIPTDSVKKRLNQRAQLWLGTLESQRSSQLSTLATIASISPYIGLLATVLGIMQAFLVIGQSQASASIEQLAPGLAEALIATALGLVVAIPAHAAHYLFQSSYGKAHSRLLENNLLFIDNLEFIPQE